MYQRHTVIRFGSVIVTPLFFFGGLPLLLAYIGDVDGFKPVAWVLLGLTILITAAYCWKLVLLSFGRVIIDETGISATIPFRKIVNMKWEDVKYVTFRTYSAGGLYDQLWFCFIGEKDTFPIKCNKLKEIPYPSENCIYMVYSEFVWELILKHAKSKVYYNTMFQSREIE